MKSTNLVILGCYGFCDGYYAYGQCFSGGSEFETVSFYPIYELLDLSRKGFVDPVNELDKVVSGIFLDQRLYTERIINHQVPKDYVIVSHNNDFLSNTILNGLPLIQHLDRLHQKYHFKMIQINWDAHIATHARIDHFFDLCLCADPSYLSVSDKVRFFPQGYHPLSTYYCHDDNYRCDVSFIGTNLYANQQYPNQSLSRKVVLDTIYADPSINLHVYCADQS